MCVCACVHLHFTHAASRGSHCYLQEYNFVKNIANIVANKQLAHIVLLGGDRDCHSIFETALVDRVKCELLYVPGRVNHNYLRGEALHVCLQVAAGAFTLVKCNTVIL